MLGSQRDPPDLPSGWRTPMTELHYIHLHHTQFMHAFDKLFSMMKPVITVTMTSQKTRRFHDRRKQTPAQSLLPQLCPVKLKSLQIMFMS